MPLKLSVYLNLPMVARVSGSTRMVLLVDSERHATRPSPSSVTLTLALSVIYQVAGVAGALRELEQIRPTVRFGGHVRLRLDLPVRTGGAPFLEGDSDECGVPIE